MHNSALVGYDAGGTGYYLVTDPGEGIEASEGGDVGTVELDFAPSPATGATVLVSTSIDDEDFGQLEIGSLQPSSGVNPASITISGHLVELWLNGESSPVAIPDTF